MSGGRDLPDRATTVAAARKSIARGSQSFAAASGLLDRCTREHARLLYAWCRRCDDLADGQQSGRDGAPVPDPQARLALIRELTLAALDGRATGDPAFDALAIVAAETPLPCALVLDLVEGFALDLDDWRLRGEGDLYRYCYHVAGTVGGMMAVVMGVDPADRDTIDRACDLGIAFQLANIARDLEADDRMGRCYLPMEWLAEMDIPPGQHMKPPFRSRLSVMARWLVEEAARFEDSARVGTARLPFRSAWAVLAAAGIYGAIGRAVVKRGDHAWDHRVATSRAAKLGWIARAAGQAAMRHRLYPATPRPDDLWRRP